MVAVCSLLQFSQFSRHCRREGGCQLRNKPPGGIEEYSNPPSPGQLCISFAWKECQSPATHPTSPPGLLLVPKASRTHSCQEFMKRADTYHRTENLTCCNGNLGFFAQQRIKPVSIPRASGAVFDLEIELPTLKRSGGQCYCTIFPISCLTVPLYVLPL